MIPELDLFDVLLSRLHEPAHFSRLLAAKRIGEVLRNPTAEKLRGRFLKHLSGAQNECQVLDMLAALAFADPAKWTTVKAVQAMIAYPSIASDAMLGRILGSPATGTWAKSHSGKATKDVTESDRFVNDQGTFYTGVHLLALKHFAQELRRVSLVKQFAWEALRLEQTGGYPSTSFGYLLSSNRDVVTAFSCRRVELYTCAFLRTVNFACAVAGLKIDSARALVKMVIPVDVTCGTVEATRPPLSWPTFQTDSDAKSMLSEITRLEVLAKFDSPDADEVIVSARGPIYRSEKVFVDAHVESSWRQKIRVDTDPATIFAAASGIGDVVIKSDGAGETVIEAIREASHQFPPPWPVWQIEQLQLSDVFPDVPITEGHLTKKATSERIEFYDAGRLFASWRYWRNQWRFGHPIDTSWTGAALSIHREKFDKLQKAGWRLKRDVSFVVRTRDESYLNFKSERFPYSLS